MDNPCVEQFVFSLAQSLTPGYPEFISKLNFSECNKEIDSLLNDRYDAQPASKGPLLRCMILNFHRQINLACQSKAAVEQEVNALRAQNAFLLQEVQTANKKALKYLEDLHSAESDLFSHKEDLLKLRLEGTASHQFLNQCDSGYSDSHSSSSVRLTPSSLPTWDRIPSDPKSLGIKSPPEPPLTGRGNSFLTSHLSDSDTDIDDTCSLSSRTHCASFTPQPLMHDTFFRAQLSKGGTSTFNNVLAPRPQPERPVAGDARARTSQCPRFDMLEFLAKDIEQFDPDNCDHNIDNYFRELDLNLSDVPNATEREKVKLVLKTSSTAVHKFIHSLPSSVTCNFTELRQALVEEFSSTADEITSIITASQIKHSRRENPKDYFRRLRHVYFQGKNAPGLEENPNFKSLFLRNLHPCIRTHVVLMTQEGKPSMQQIRKMSQVAWETVVTAKATQGATEPVKTDTKVSNSSAASKLHPQNKTKGGDRRQRRDTERIRHVHQVPRDRHSHSRSCRKPYSDILAQTTHHYSEDDDSISEYSSKHGYDRYDRAYSDSASEVLLDSGSAERYSPEPRHRRSRARFSRQ